MQAGSHRRPRSDAPTASSVYSQSSPPQIHKLPKLDIPRASSVYPDDVSPPDSPTANEAGRSRSRKSSMNVSPITESPNTAADRHPANGKPSSHIPVLKKSQKYGGARELFSGWRTKGAGADSPGRELTPTNLTRWDDFSGEPTNSEKGKPAQAIPGAVNFDSESSPVTRNEGLGVCTTVNDGTLPRKRVGSKGTNEAPWPPREEWKGASGRHKIVNPLVDKPLPPGKSLTFPAGMQRRIGSPADPSPTRDVVSPTTGRSSQRRTSQPKAPSKRNVSGKPVDTVINGESGNPPRVDSVGTGKNNPPRVMTTPAPQQVSQDPAQELDLQPLWQPAQKSVQVMYPTLTGLSPEDTRSPLARNPSTEAMKDERQQSTPETTPSGVRLRQESVADEGGFRTTMQHLQLEEQPRSRFSATTYATTAYDSPPMTPEINSDSAVPPMPTPPMSIDSPSILNRKRPVPPAGIPSVKATTRKPTPSQMDVSSTSEMENDRHTKSLPKSPPEVDAVSRVASLQATLDNLRRRRSNLQTVIHELTNVVQPSSIAYDIASRQEIKKTVNGLSKELAEVVKEEHETGLKLHRAWKRSDENDFESVLWVRRIAS